MHRSFAIALISVVLLTNCGRDQASTLGSAIRDLEPISLDEPLSEPGTRTAIHKIIGSASIVALGESRHDTMEQFQLKSKLVKLMISDLGFRTVVFEESFSHALAIDAYVTAGEGDIRSILSGLAGWYLWDTEEMLDLVEWIRNHNETVGRDRLVRIAGMDITAPALGVQNVVAIAQAVDLTGAWSTRDYGLDLHQGDYWPQTLRRYESLDAPRRTLIGKNLDDLVSFTSELAKKEQKDRGYFDARLLAIQAEIARRGHEMFSADSIAAIGARREDGMAFVVEWVLNEVSDAAGIVIWTHNLHASENSFRMPQMADGELFPMGVTLSEKFGADYLAIGGAFGTGHYSADLPPGERSFERMDSASVDGAFGEITNGSFLVDLQDLDESSEAASWLREDHEWRMQDTTAILSPLRGFDAIYYVEEVSRATLTPNALRRHQVGN